MQLQFAVLVIHHRPTQIAPHVLRINPRMCSITIAEWLQQYLISPRNAATNDIARRLNCDAEQTAARHAYTTDR